MGQSPQHLARLIRITLRIVTVSNFDTSRVTRGDLRGFRTTSIRPSRTSSFSAFVWFGGDPGRFRHRVGDNDRRSRSESVLIETEALIQQLVRQSVGADTCCVLQSQLQILGTIV
jgi:hypothetical protein